MEQADLARKYKRKQEINPAVLDGIIETTPKLSEDARIQQATKLVKEKWSERSHHPTSPGEDKDGHGER